MKTQLSNMDRRQNYIILAENSYLDDEMERLLSFILNITV